MAMHSKKRKGTGRTGKSSSRRNPSRKRSSTIESGGRSSDMETGERA